MSFLRWRPIYHLLFSDLAEIPILPLLLSMPNMTLNPNLDVNLLGELLTPQGIFQDSNCKTGSCCMAKYDYAEVLKNGLKVNTFVNGKCKLLFDTGTSMTLSSHREDFVTYTPLKKAKVITGAAGKVDVKGKGMVKYVVQDQKGELLTLQLPAYHVPDMSSHDRLLRPQAIKTDPGFRGYYGVPTDEDDVSDQSILEIYENVPNWKSTKPVRLVTVSYDKASKLPFVMGKTMIEESYAFCAPEGTENEKKALSQAIGLTEQANANLTAAQKELL